VLQLSGSTYREMSKKPEVKVALGVEI